MLPPLSDVRPISLRNCSNNMFFRVLYERLIDLLPALISFNEDGFVKGRSIAEKTLLT